MNIRIEPPMDDVRRERVEQQMFSRLDAIRAALVVPASEAKRDNVERALFERLTAMRGIERADAFTRSRRRWVPIVAFAGVGALLVIVVVGLRGTEPSPTRREAVITQHVVSPTGGPSRWISADAVVEASGDTSVEERIDDEGVTLTLSRGTVDCDVEPRPGRAPFRVIAGDVKVEVIGTRFTVQRTPTGVRVDVVRGRVRVTGPNADSLLTAGGTWSSEPVVTAKTPPMPSIEPRIDEAQIDLAPTSPDKPKAISPKEAFEVATRLEKRDIAGSARMYRVAANGRDQTYAALSLYSLAELERRRGASTTALRVIDEYLRRFPRGANVEELLWLRVDIHRAAKQTDALKAAATDYLRRFPSGTYAKPAQNLAGP